VRFGSVPGAWPEGRTVRMAPSLAALAVYTFRTPSYRMVSPA
jgi:hypothetical protein